MATPSERNRRAMRKEHGGRGAPTVAWQRSFVVTPPDTRARDHRHGQIETAISTASTSPTMTAMTVVVKGHRYAARCVSLVNARCTVRCWKQPEITNAAPLRTINTPAKL